MKDKMIERFLKKKSELYSKMLADEQEDLRSNKEKHTAAFLATDTAAFHKPQA
ncbi:hypothetical protein [Paenibacillus taihuensis]|uniref:hypothetical protein n=1 Tax=Paenibacillus taihuensis TaxID=1156355 RepID=UPI0015F28E83|nr:hypothetical protein [Paenibacillus taihuensis]